MSEMISLFGEPKQTIEVPILLSFQTFKRAMIEFRFVLTEIFSFRIFPFSLGSEMMSISTDVLHGIFYIQIFF